MSLTRKGMLLSLLVITAVVAAASPALAQASWSEQVTVASGQTLEGPQLLVGQSVTVDGTVDGDLYVAAQSLRVTGEIRGDLLGLAADASLGGRVLGDLRLAGGQVNLSGQVEGSVACAASSLYLERNAGVSRDLLWAGETLGASGVIGRHLVGTGRQVFLNGVVKGDVRLYDLDALRLGRDADLQGRLKYSSPARAERDPGAVVVGREDWTATPGRGQGQVEAYAEMAATFLGFVLVWAVVRLLAPRLWTMLGDEIRERPLRTLVVGCLLFAGIPLLAVVLGLTVVGAPLAMLMGGAYLAALYLSTVIVADLLGSLVGRRLLRTAGINAFWLFLLGLSLVLLLGRVPQAGAVMSLMVMWWGMGSLAVAVLRRRGALG
ncbi:MAG: polymer-forming cytoskeletal protein [Syntrophomonadaceae bacterium]|nr:polymer-forming cytoskeletal protein [Syntrophomonadaceae bacterium]